MTADLRHVIQATELINLRLVRLEAALDSKVKPSPTQALRTRVESHLVEMRREKRQRLLVAGCKFMLGHQDDAVPIKFLIQYEAFYRVDDPALTEEDFDSFVRDNVPFNVWPYLRELVTTLSLRMLLSPPLTLPLYKPGLFTPDEEQQEAEA